MSSIDVGHFNILKGNIKEYIVPQNENEEFNGPKKAQTIEKSFRGTDGTQRIFNDKDDPRLIERLVYLASKC